MNALRFDQLRDANTSRVVRWHDPATDAWTVADWSNAMCGEAGEAANVVKKLRRHESGTATDLDPDEHTLRQMLAAELADVVTYADLLAHHCGIDLGEAVVHKFNLVSRRQGFPERLGD